MRTRGVGEQIELRGLLKCGAVLGGIQSRLPSAAQGHSRRHLAPHLLWAASARRVSAAHGVETRMLHQQHSIYADCLVKLAHLQTDEKAVQLRWQGG